jgi:pyrroline-5-carboxylate reductase
MGVAWTLTETNARGLVLLGCGKMGSALLKGWLARGLQPQSVHVIEPHPSDWLRGTGVALNGPLPPEPAVVLLAVKPQMMGEALPADRGTGVGRTLFVSIAAGTPLAGPAGLGATARGSCARCPTRPPPSAGASPR